MNEPKCDLCGSKRYKSLCESQDYRFFSTEEHFSLFECGDCGLVYLNPMLAKEEWAKFYPKAAAYYPSFKHHGTLFGRGVDLVSRLLYLPRIFDIRRYKKSGKLLDIGFGTGYFLYFMKERGFDIYGVDTADEVCDFVSGKLGEKNKIFNKELKDCNFGSDEFDLVTLLHVLEHLPDPMEHLQEIHRILKPDGVLMIEVPNIDSIAYKILGKYWFQLDIPRHVYHFSVKSLSAMLDKYGYKVKKVSTFSMRIFFASIRGCFHVMKRYRVGYILSRILILLAVPFILAATVISRFMPKNGEIIRLYAVKK